MEMIEKLETTLGGWFKQAPHLPANVQKWIAQNVWWLTLIGVVLSAFAILAVLPILFGASLFLASIGGAYGYYSGLGLVNTWVVSFGFGIAILVIEAFAIKPLKSLSKKGWNLIFLSMILSVASSVVSAVLL
ncbi:MAG: hypothetical protein ABJA64_01355, partial [Candidatus Saccharibacteria bacterium]